MKNPDVELLEEMHTYWGMRRFERRHHQAIGSVLERMKILEHTLSNHIALAKHIWHADERDASLPVKDTAREIIDGAREALG